MQQVEAARNRTVGEINIAMGMRLNLEKLLSYLPKEIVDLDKKDKEPKTE